MLASPATSCTWQARAYTVPYNRAVLKTHFPINIIHFQLYGIHYGWLKLPEFLNPHARKTFQDFHRSYFFKRVPGFLVNLAKVRLKKQGEPLRFRKILNGRRIAKVESKTTSHYLSKSNKKRLSASIFRARARAYFGRQGVQNFWRRITRAVALGTAVLDTSNPDTMERVGCRELLKRPWHFFFFVYPTYLDVPLLSFGLFTGRIFSSLASAAKQQEEKQIEICRANKGCVQLHLVRFDAAALCQNLSR